LNNCPGANFVIYGNLITIIRPNISIRNLHIRIVEVIVSGLSADSMVHFSREMAKYYRACAKEVYVFSREIFRFASEIKSFSSK